MTCSVSAILAAQNEAQLAALNKVLGDKVDAVSHVADPEALLTSTETLNADAILFYGSGDQVWSDALLEARLISPNRLLTVMALYPSDTQVDEEWYANADLDDWLEIPSEEERLLARLGSLDRIQGHYQHVLKKLDGLEHYKQHSIDERERAQHIFDNMFEQGCLDAPYIRRMISANSILSGDLLLADQTPDGRLILVIGDFTGHGLSAAVGTLPVASQFHRLTQEDASLSDIILETNTRLHTLLPTSMFFSCIALEISNENILSMCNAGMPPAFLRHRGGHNITLFESKSLPLGIVPTDEYDVELRFEHISPEDRILLYSDGVVEARNADGEMFGVERIREIVQRSREDSIYDDIITEIFRFSDGGIEHDDTSICEVTVPKL